jgi:hypothetical protein
MPNDEWSPDKELPDKEDEQECQREARARARVSHLVKSYEPKPEKGAPTKKRKGLFHGSSE